MLLRFMANVPAEDCLSGKKREKTRMNQCFSDKKKKKHLLKFLVSDALTHITHKNFECKKNVYVYI